MNANLEEERTGEPPEIKVKAAVSYPIDLRKSAELLPFIGGAFAGLVTLLAFGWLLFKIFYTNQD